MEPKKILNFKEFALLESIYGDLESGNKNISQEAFKKMRACIFFLNGSHPFFASLIAKLVIRENRNLRYRTMATDGFSIHYDPDFVLALPPDEIKWVIAHEIMHNVLQHFLRCPKDETMSGIWNVACDYALNQIISPPTYESIQSGKPQPDPKASIGNMPDGSLYPGCGQHPKDERFLGLAAEKIYKILKEEGFTPDVPPKGTPPPPPPPPPPPDPPQDPTVGDVIFDAANNTYGVVTAYDNVSGEVEYDPIPKEKIKEFAKKPTPKL